MSDLGLGNGALGIVALIVRARVVGRKNGGGRSHDRADLVVHLFGLGLVHDLAAEDGAGRGIAGGLAVGDGHVRVLVEVVVVVCLGADDGARLARLGEVDVGVRRREGRVDSSDDGALLDGGHLCEWWDLCGFRF